MVLKFLENISDSEKDTVYEKIFETIEEYITDVLAIKMKKDPNNKLYAEIVDDYNNFERFTVGKLDTHDIIEKNMILLSISRKLFTHSLPLLVAEQCYEKLLLDVRTLIMDTKIARKQEKAYGLLINLIEDYNLKLLSTKIYWDKPAKREEYKLFWEKYKAINELKNSNYLEYSRQREILFLKSEMKVVYSNENRYCRIISFYKSKLVSLGAMRKISNKAISEGNYTQKSNVLLNMIRKVEVV